jgi:hypothetical protein
MKLSVLRKHAIRNQTRVRFTLSNGMDCVITETGVATVPGLNQPPSFDLEDELKRAGQFVLESVGNRAGGARRLSRAELAALTGGGPVEDLHDHDE